MIKDANPNTNTKANANDADSSKSKSSHKGENVGGDFVDLRGRPVDRQKIRAYVYKKFMANEILDMVESSVGKVMEEFLLKQKDYKKIADIIKRVIAGGREQEPIEYGNKSYRRSSS